MNPPFGTKRRGVDIHFLFVALNLATQSVFSMHKSSTRDYIQKRFSMFGVRAEALAEMNFNIGRTYAYQTRSDMDISVDLWRFDVSEARLITRDELGHVVERPLNTIGNASGASIYDVRTRKMQRNRGRRRRK